MPRSNTRARMVLSAIGLLRERGVDGVTLDAVIADSGAPRGSIYHHFPGGRTELVMIAGRAAADFITQLIGEVAATGDPVAALESFADFWKRSLSASDYRAGCPIAGLAANSSAAAADVVGLAAETFASWTRHLTSAFERAGFESGKAASLATMTLASIEGAILLCRSSRSTRPIDDVITHLRPLLDVKGNDR
ncbi:MAG: TetR/AcrR family transcriptional regulator [Sciscionella sp.]|nr:TetR/AcrR family transcriptional regulator [Sciscionella sp.]